MILGRRERIKVKLRKINPHQRQGTNISTKAQNTKWPSS
jgi:hypothetical protein